MQDIPIPGAPTPARDIYSVSRLVREARAALEGSFPLIWLEGEISNFSRPSSGHMYFSLKDEAAQVRCALFRNRNLQLRFRPENGMHVLVRARLTLYEARGDFQIVVEHMEEAGLGALQRAFEALKARLGREGLFEMDHKRPLPTLPRRIGVITSPTGAAIRDVLSVLRRRFPAIPVLIYPVPVQGAQAAGEIAEMIKLADRRRDCDVLILARGGGSLEDLWAFNEEVVARAIHACETPLVAAVGHEVDFTIADFVADQRAPTPSAAAELVSPDRQEWLQGLAKQVGRLHQCVGVRLRQSTQTLAWLEQRLQRCHPAQGVQLKAQRLDELELRLQRQIKQGLAHKAQRLALLHGRLQHHAPLRQLAELRQRQRHLEQRLHHAWERLLTHRRQRLALSGRMLDSVSPLATLQRGYAIVQDVSARKVYRDAGELQRGDRIAARLARGSLICTVNEINKESP